GINQMRYLPVTREFENVDVPRNIRMDIGTRVFERIADAWLSAEMDDPVYPAARKRMRERIRIAEVDIDECEQFIVECLEMRDACALKIEGVIGSKIIDPDDGFVAAEQRRRDVHSDEPGSTGNKRRQISSPCGSSGLCSQ